MKKNNNEPAVTITPELAAQGTSSWIKRFRWILFAIAFLVYGNSLNNGYNMDDQLVTRNHKLTSQGLSGIKEIFTSPYYSDDMGYSYGYRPVVHLSFALEHQIFGESPKTGHFMNVLLFAFSTFFLYHFLILLFGEKNYLYSFLICLLFAIHPIHAEVVDSLKNRDEMLSFLFLVLSGIQLLRYAEKYGTKHFLLCILFFLLALLSKKSVYPMVFVLPAAVLLLKNISFKRLFFLAIILTFPAAVLASELQTARLIVLFCFPLAALFLVHILNNFSYEKDKKYVWIVPAIAIILISALCVVKNTPELLILIIPFFIWLFRLDFNKGIWGSAILFLGLGVYFDEEIFYRLSIMLSLGMSLFLYYFKKEKNIPLFIFFCITLIGFFILKQKFGTLIVTLHFWAFIWLLYKYPRWSVVFSFLSLILIILFSENRMAGGSFYTISISLAALLWFIYDKTNKKYLIKYIPVITMIIAVSMTSYNYYLNSKQQKHLVAKNTVEETELKKTKPNDGKNIFKEGRDLEYVENPLVKKHTKSETVATGFYTLGTYFNLMIFPKDLSFYYGYATIDIQKISSSGVIISIVIHLAMVFLILFYFRKNLLISIGFTWYLSCILLFSNWLELVAGVVGERLAFLASAGFFIGIAGLMQEFRLIEKWKKPALVSLAVIGILLAGRTWVRNADWKDQYTLMKHDIRHLDKSAQANNLYATNLMREGIENQQLTSEQKALFFKAGVKHFRKATEIYPDFFNAQYDLGRSAMYISDTLGAINAFKECIRIDSVFSPAKEHVAFLESHYSGGAK